MALKVKSVYSPIDRSRDGLRLLVTRVRGRGLSGTRYDEWLANLGPSEVLLHSIQHGKLSWAAFRRQYTKELFLDGPIDKRSRNIKNHGQKFTLRLIKTLARKGNVTLMCHCDEDQKNCHRHVLRRLILSSRV